ncbi:unnamed protein product [Cyprideis torosa]|uniref:Uncharacterized protein n=1 Tax=Cyprideis torosa TaxID=163714 RepID=A0A7R8ZKK7_9CRUS|nr:unnamed protein product [Cyprideis torosa]CAG0884655.1 unnamed protein product [Cyprideis torosa]
MNEYSGDEEEEEADLEHPNGRILRTRVEERRCSAIAATLVLQIDCVASLGILMTSLGILMTSLRILMTSLGILMTSLGILMTSLDFRVFVKK